MNKLLLFPSGVCGNGSHILTFKKGAFLAEKRLTPLYIKVDLGATLSIAYDVVDAPPMIFLQMCWYCCQRI